VVPTERCHPEALEGLAGKGLRTYFDGAQYDTFLFSTGPATTSSLIYHVIASDSVASLHDRWCGDNTDHRQNNSDAKVKPISAPDAELFAEIGEIKKAFNNVAKIKAGKLKGRPASDLLNKL
jgi:hypothetical protein